MNKNLLSLLFFKLVMTSAFIFADGVEDAFTNIYRTGHWGKNGEGTGTSGAGSTIGSTQIYRDFLQEFLKTNQIKSVIDIGCGDWEFSKLINWEGIDYIGIDIVKNVIERNTQLYSAPNIQFVYGNFLFLDLPKVDLLICKDVLQHLPNHNILQFLPQLKKYSHCIITNDVNPQTLTSHNQDIIPGHYRLLDLTNPPFNIEGLKVLNYFGGGTTKQVLYIYHPQEN